MIRIAGVAGMLVALSMIQPSGPEMGEKPAERHQEWNFDHDPIGRLPKGWVVDSTHPGKSPAEWVVTADLTAPSRPNVLTLIKSNSEDGTYNLAIQDQTAYRDLELNVRIKANHGKVDQGGGLVWRYRDRDNYFVCRVNPLESNFRVYVVEKGKRRQLNSCKIDSKAGKWYALRVVMVGDEISCYLDGKKLLRARDGTFKHPGKIGFWTKADAASSFDDLNVREMREQSRSKSEDDPRKDDDK